MNAVKLRKALPQKRIIDIEGRRFLLVHSELTRNFSTEELSDAYAGERADVVVFGHIHSRTLVTKNECLYINPGSLGISKCGLGSFAVLSLKDTGGIEVDFKTISWDRDLLRKDFEQKAIPKKESILHDFFGFPEQPS